MRRQFYKFAWQNAPKVQMSFAPCRNSAVYTKRRGRTAFPPVENSVESVQNLLCDGLFHRFHRVFNSRCGEIFHITARINRAVNLE
jgi:hypothetical protein